MTDHINITHPDKLGIDSHYYRDMLEIEKLKLEIRQLRMWYDKVEGDLQSVFTRTEKGQNTELHYPDGRIFVISGKPR